MLLNPLPSVGELQEPGLDTSHHLHDRLQRVQTFLGSCNSLVMSSPYFMPCSGFHSWLGMGQWPDYQGMISFVSSKHDSNSPRIGGFGFAFDNLRIDI